MFKSRQGQRRKWQIKKLDHEMGVLLTNDGTTQVTYFLSLALDSYDKGL